jgi:hypothetical protein
MCYVCILTINTKGEIMADIKDIITNIEQIYGSNNSLSLLKDFERVIDELDVYVYDNWIDGELVEGPKETRYFVECTFMWPKDKMPEPKGGMRLIEYGCEVKMGETKISQVRKIKTPDDIRPGTRKGKIDRKSIWLVKISMPKKLMSDINRGYIELDQNKIEDIITKNGGVNAAIDPAEQQAQEMANAEPAAAPAA